MPSLGFASAAAIQQYLTVAQERHLDWRSALEAAGIQEADLQDGQNRFSGEQFQGFLAHLIASANDPLLGLHTSAHVQPGSYNVLGYIVMNCATVGEAMARIIPYEKLVGDMGVSRILSETGQLCVEWHCQYTDPTVRPHMIANVLASWVKFCRWLANREDASPLAVELEFQPEDEAIQREAFEAVFRCPIRFGCNRSALIVNPAMLDIPLRQPDQILRKTLESHADQQMANLSDPNLSLVEKTRQQIRDFLAEGISRQDSVAESLGLTARTLQRRLGEEGSSYQTLLDEIRLEIARKSLSESEEAVADIAQRLGYAEPRSFHRAFKHWTGQTPGDFRAYCRTGPSPPVR